MPEAPKKILIWRLLINKFRNFCPFISFTSLNDEHKIQFKDTRCLEAVNVSRCNIYAIWNNWCLYLPGDDIGFNVFWIRLLKVRLQLHISYYSRCARFCETQTLHCLCGVF